MADSSHGRSGPAGPYASALFALAAERDAVGPVEAGLDGVVRLVEGSEDLRRAVRSPVLPRAAQARAMAAVLEAAGADPLVRSFVGVVARHRRLPALAAIAREFRALAAERRGEAEAVVESAVELPEGLAPRIEEAVSSALGRRAVLRTSVDPELLGGLRVRVGSTLVDGSLRTKLRTIGQAMKGAA